MPAAIVRRVLLAALLVALVPVVAGWSNGPDGGNGFGTHDWVLYQADMIARDAGVTWLDWKVAQPVTDDPDTVLHDTYHHVYDIWGSRYGDAPTKVAQLYSQTVKHLKDGDRVDASKSFGLLSHYFSDVCQPMHTDQCAAENAIHGRYELDAQTYTDTPTENQAWIVPDGLTYVSDPASETEQAATTAHSSYTLLVTEYVARGMDATATAITRRSLNLAANELADLLFSAERDAGGEVPALALAGSRLGTPPLAGVATGAAESTTAAAWNRVLPEIRASDSKPSPSARSAAPTNPFSALLVWTIAAAGFSSALFGALQMRGTRKP